MPYLATISIPGYLPQDDEPPVFNTAEEAWQYLADMRRENEDQTDEESYSEALNELRYLAVNSDQYGSLGSNADESGEGNVIGDTPGYDGDHDLGLVYSVTYLDDHDERAYPLGTTERLDCGCLAHNTRTTNFSAFYCDAEEQGYCNFEHVCGLDDEILAGTPIHIVDQLGATFAFTDKGDADAFAINEIEGGSEEVTQWSINAPRDSMSLYELAEYAISGEDD